MSPPLHGTPRPPSPLTRPRGSGARYRTVRFGVVGSTNDVALEAAGAGSAPGLVVVARRQARGKGRRARDWESPEGGLWASVVLDPGIDTAIAGHVPLAVGSACADALRGLGADVSLRWPNDLMLDDEKVGGLLVESRTDADRFDVVVAGIGINVANDAPVPGSTTLRGRLDGPEPSTVLEAILARLADHEAWLREGNVKRLCERFMARAWGIDRALLLDGEPVTPREIAIDGALVVEREDGRMDVVRAGSLRLP